MLQNGSFYAFNQNMFSSYIASVFINYYKIIEKLRTLWLVSSNSL